MRRFEVADDSMRPNYQPGDYLVAAKRRLRRGDVVVFPVDGRHLLKRVIGLPGDHVGIAEGSVLIDDVYFEEAYTDHHTSPDGTWVVGPSQVFVLSDARELTRADSRTFGPLESGGMLRVLFRYRKAHTKPRIPRV